jgi:prepilin peptidase CpaA
LDQRRLRAVQIRRKGLTVLLLVSAAAAIVLLIASYHDLRHRSIPNTMPIAVASAALVKWLVIAQFAPALWAAAAAAMVFAATALLFARGWLGGGDVKLAAAVVFFLGAPATAQFLLLMALIGGVLALAMLAGQRRPRAAATDAAASIPAVAPTIPYGVAIAAAGIAMMVLDWRGGSVA